MTKSLCHSWVNNSFTHFPLHVLDSNCIKMIIHLLFEKICSKRDTSFDNFKSIMINLMDVLPQRNMYLPSTKALRKGSWNSLSKKLNYIIIINIITFIYLKPHKRHNVYEIFQMKIDCNIFDHLYKKKRPTSVSLLYNGALYIISDA